MFHIVFIHSSVRGHLAFFCLLVTVTNDATNMGVQVSFWISAFSPLGVNLTVEWLDHVVLLCVTSGGSTTPFDGLVWKG